MIPFNVPPCVGTELQYIKEAIESHKICGDGAFTKKMQRLAGGEIWSSEGSADDQRDYSS